MSDKLYSPIIYDPISKIYYKQELNTHVGIVLNAQQQFVNKLIKQRDQYKAENEKLRERNKKLEKRNNQKVRRYLRGGLQQMRIEDLENKYNGMIAERNNLIDDLSWYKAKVSRLERENEKLRVKRDLFFERWKFKSEMYIELYEESQSYKSLLSEISQHIGNKPSSSTYKYFRAKLDGIGIKEGADNDRR
jgi:cell shape-determining protein MreC